MARTATNARRSHVEKGIYEHVRADGIRSFEIGFTDASGQWKMETVGDVSIEEARLVRLQRIAAARRPGRASNRRGLSVSDVGERYLASRLPTLKPGSRKQYCRVVRHPLRDLPSGKPLGSRRVEDVQPHHFGDWIEAVWADHAESTTLTYTSIASQVFNWAVNHELIDVNPYFRIDRWLLPKRGAARHRIPTAAELSLLLLVADDDERDLFELAFGAGPRRGELAGSRWMDWTPGSGILNIEHQLDAELELVSLKSTDSERQIVLAPVTEEMLERRYERLGRPPGHHFIFGTRGRPSRPAGLSSAFATAVDRAGIPQPEGNRLVLHSLRHLYATLLFTQHELTDDFIARQLGHASARETKRSYRHLWRQFRRPAQLIDEMETLLRGLCQGVSDLGIDLSQSTAGE